MTATAGFTSRYGPRALVAGGSEGIGAAFACELAQRGLDLVLVAERSEPLESFARTLEQEHGVAVRSLVLDLGTTDLLEHLLSEVGDLDVGLLVYNAAVSQIGTFLSQSASDLSKALDVNCRGPLLLAHEYGRRMVARGRGGIILLSSLAGRQGTALVSTYAATKAFDLVLGEGLWDELRSAGVDVLALCPGATRTPGWERSGAARQAFVPLMEPAAVVREALGALGRTPSRIVGHRNRWLHGLLGVLPRRSAITLLSRSMHAQYPGRR